MKDWELENPFPKVIKFNLLNSVPNDLTIILFKTSYEVNMCLEFYMETFKPEPRYVPIPLNLSAPTLPIATIQPQFSN